MLKELAKITNIHGGPVLEIERGETVSAEKRDKAFIWLDHDTCTITFRIARPAEGKYPQMKGCGVDALVAVAKHVVDAQNKTAPSPEGERALKGLTRAMEALAARKVNRKEE